LWLRHLHGCAPSTDTEQRRATGLAGDCGLGFSDDWMVWVADGAIIYGTIPVKDAAVSMINRKFGM
jgi:hypothetical protein